VDLELTVLGGPDEGRTWRYDGMPSVILGRSGTPDRDLGFPTDPRMSREHVLLEERDGALHAVALRADLSFKHRGRRVREAVLVHGDEVVIGASRIRVGVVHHRRVGLASAATGTLELDVPRRRLEEFRLEGELGRGTLGVVHRAVDTTTGEVIALKVLRVGADVPAAARSYFLREMEVLRRLQHPGIARLRCVGWDDRAAFLGTELVPGRSLDMRVAREGPLGEGASRELGRQLLAALEHAHDSGFVHRDVKPGNVMVEERGPDELRCVLLDFSLARNCRDTGMLSLTRTGEGRGTLLFAAPECLRDAKHATYAADVFGVGATLYWALTEKPWFEQTGDTFDDVMSARLMPLARSRPGTDPSLAATIERALAADLAVRWPSAALMREALET
jgi:serine/threonine-protein kinase